MLKSKFTHRLFALAFAVNLLANMAVAERPRQDRTLAGGNARSAATLADFPVVYARVATIPEGSGDWGCGSKSKALGTLTPGDIITLNGKLSPLVSPFDSVDCVTFQLTKKSKVTITPSAKMDLAVTPGGKNFPGFGAFTLTLNPGTYTLSMATTGQSKLTYSVAMKVTQ